MEVYYFISNLDESDYDFFSKKINLISNRDDVDTVLDKYVYKIWAENEDTTRRAAFVEACVFIKTYIEKYSGKITDITWVYKENFVSFNKSVFILKQNKWYELISDSLFVTSRDQWIHPFFYFMVQWSFSKNISICKPNIRKDWRSYDKLFFVQKLWKYREEYLWDVVIPFFMSVDNILILKLLSFIEERIGSKCILKKNFWVEWLAVKALDTNRLKTDKNIKGLKASFFNQKNLYSWHGVYITPFYNIEKEYRLYYTYFDEKISLFSVKHKSYESPNTQTIFSMKDFSKNSIKILWEYCSVGEFLSKNKSVYEEAIVIIKNLGLHTGVLEVVKTKEWTIRFIEVNPLWGTLMFKWEDEKWIQDYYSNLWSSLLENSL